MIRLILLLVLSLPTIAMSTSINDLVNNGQVDIKATLNIKEGNASVNEQIILYIDVGTSRWFAGGTRIHPFAVNNVIVPFSRLNSTNYTDNKGGQTWSRQRWEVRLFAQATGDYTIPPIAVSVTVSTDAGNVSGTLYTHAVSFSASTPSWRLDPSSDWFAASSIEAKQTWQVSHDPLSAGDSITRTVTIKADDTVSMMIANPIKQQNSPLYHRYANAPVLTDELDRGDYSSTRVDQETYLLQQGGTANFSDLTITWYNTSQQRVETTVLPGASYSIKHTLSSLAKQYLDWIIVIAALLVVMLLGYVSVRRYYRDRPIPERIAIRHAVKEQRWGYVRTLIYRRLRANKQQIKLKDFDASEQWQDKSKRIQSDNISGEEAQSAWQSVNKKTYRWWRPKKALPQLDRLNKQS